MTEPKLHHPAIPKRHELSVGDRAADAVRNGMGSWGFVISFLAGMGVWMAVNSLMRGFDPFPFILLNLMLSLIAGLQGAILLIAAKREDKVNSALAHDHYTNDVQMMHLLAEVHVMSEDLHAHLIKDQDAENSSD